MPEQQYPPFSNDAGALTIPRQLIRWLDINPQGGALRRTRGYFEMPAFQFPSNGNLAPYYPQYGNLLGAFYFTAAKPFTIKSLSSPLLNEYTLCIAYKLDDDIVHRYKLTTDNDMFYSEVPAYAGQLIDKNFRLEVWYNTGTEGIGTFVVQTTAIKFYTSNLGNFDYRFQQDFSVATGTSTDSFSVSTNGTGTFLTISGGHEANGIYIRTTDYLSNPQYLLTTNNSDIVYYLRYDGASIVTIYQYKISTATYYEKYYTTIPGSYASWLSNPSATTWTQGTDGSSPVPTTTAASTSSTYSLPLTFPANSNVP